MAFAKPGNSDANRNTSAPASPLPLPKSGEGDRSPLSRRKVIIPRVSRLDHLAPRGEVRRRPGHRPGTRRVVTAVGEGGPPRGATKAGEVPSAVGLDQGQLFTSPRRVAESANLAAVCAKSARKGLDQSASRGLLFGHGSTAGNTRGTLARSASFDVALFAFRPEWGSNITAQGIALGRRSRTCRMP